MLRKSGRSNEPVEVVFVVGRNPSGSGADGSGWSEEDRVRVCRYDALLGDARASYMAFLRERTDAGRVSRLLDEIEAAGTD